MRFLLCAALALVCTACAAGQPSVELKGKRFSVEIADTREKQALGLMYRDSMPLDHGMLFIFPREAPRSFWSMNVVQAAGSWSRRSGGATSPRPANLPTASFRNWKSVRLIWRCFPILPHCLVCSARSWV